MSRIELRAGRSPDSAGPMVGVANVMVDDMMELSRVSAGRIERRPHALAAFAVR